jgi:hypothetical protein
MVTRRDTRSDHHGDRLDTDRRSVCWLPQERQSVTFFNAPIQTVQFYVPRVVLDVLDRDAVADRARKAGLRHFAYEYSTKSVPPSKARITCHFSVAAMIVEELVDVAKRSKEPLRAACAEAVSIALGALEPTKASNPGALPE